MLTGFGSFSVSQRAARSAKQRRRQTTPRNFDQQAERACSFFTEDNDVVAVFSTGAAGDQNPIYFQQTYDLRQIRIEEYAKRGEDISIDVTNPDVVLKSCPASAVPLSSQTLKRTCRSST